VEDVIRRVGVSPAGGAGAASEPTVAALVRVMFGVGDSS